MIKSRKTVFTVLFICIALLIAGCASNNDMAAPAAGAPPSTAADGLRQQHTGIEVWSLFGMGLESLQTADQALPGALLPGAFYAFENEAQDQMLAPTPAEGGGGQSVEWEDIAETGERHIIQTADIELESDYFDDVVASLRYLAPSLGGYISSEMLTRHGQKMFTIVLRVPAMTFDQALLTIQNLANVRRLSSQADDVTDQFYDLAGNLTTRRIEEERLLALIEEATSITDILALETRLSDTRLVIERYLMQLNLMAGQIAYSTIHVQLLDTAEEFVPASAQPHIGERIGGAFGESVDGTINVFQNIIVFMAGAIIPLAFLGLLGFAIFVIARGIYRKYRVRV